jgi:phosphoglycerate dehydrogenase-like enzyme
VPGAGLDRIDRSQLRPDLALANAYGHEAGIAEYVIGTMIGLTRDLRRLDQKLRVGEWQSQWSVGTPAPPLWPELAGKTLGILGFGHIGEALARRTLAFDMKVSAIRRRADSGSTQGMISIGGPEQLDELLAQSDYLAITLPLSDETRRLIDARRLSLMKPSAYLINVGRAEIVDEQALYDALAGGRLAGAALDVWYRYPAGAGNTAPATAPFHELNNVIMTPHISGWTEGMLEARAGVIAENIARTARGERPLNAVASAD